MRGEASIAEVHRGEKTDCSAVLFSSSAEICKENDSSENRTAEHKKLAIIEEKWYY